MRIIFQDQVVILRMYVSRAVLYRRFEPFTSRHKPGRQRMTAALKYQKIDALMYKIP